MTALKFHLAYLVLQLTLLKNILSTIPTIFNFLLFSPKYDVIIKRNTDSMNFKFINSLIP